MAYLRITFSDPARKGVNRWTDGKGHFEKSPVCPGPEWYPNYPANRVIFATFKPYKGDSAWVKAANAHMEAITTRNKEDLKTNREF